MIFTPPAPIVTLSESGVVLAAPPPPPLSKIIAQAKHPPHPSFESRYLLSRVKRGVRTEHACFDCHHKLAFEAKLVRIDEHSVEDVPAAGRKAGGNGGKKEKAGGAGPRIVEGHELPNLGSCDHFKKSLRWLRFPCCGKACACPVCHELDGCESLGTFALPSSLRTYTLNYMSSLINAVVGFLGSTW